MCASPDGDMRPVTRGQRACMQKKRGHGYRAPVSVPPLALANSAREEHLHFGHASKTNSPEDEHGLLVKGGRARIETKEKKRTEITVLSATFRSRLQAPQKSSATFRDAKNEPFR